MRSLTAIIFTGIAALALDIHIAHAQGDPPLVKQLPDENAAYLWTYDAQQLFDEVLSTIEEIPAEHLLIGWLMQANKASEKPTFLNQVNTASIRKAAEHLAEAKSLVEQGLFGKQAIAIISPDQPLVIAVETSGDTKSVEAFIEEMNAIVVSIQQLIRNGGQPQADDGGEEGEKRALADLEIKALQDGISATGQSGTWTLRGRWLVWSTDRDRTNTYGDYVSGSVKPTCVFGNNLRVNLAIRSLPALDCGHVRFFLPKTLIEKIGGGLKSPRLGYWDLPPSKHVFGQLGKEDIEGLGGSCYFGDGLQGLAPDAQWLVDFMVVVPQPRHGVFRAARVGSEADFSFPLPTTPLNSIVQFDLEGEKVSTAITEAIDRYMQTEQGQAFVESDYRQEDIDPRNLLPLIDLLTCVDRVTSVEQDLGFRSATESLGQPGKLLLYHGSDSKLIEQQLMDYTKSRFADLPLNPIERGMLEWELDEHNDATSVWRTTDESRAEYAAAVAVYRQETIEEGTYERSAIARADIADAVTHSRSYWFLKEGWFSGYPMREAEFDFFYENPAAEHHPQIVELQRQIRDFKSLLRLQATCFGFYRAWPAKVSQALARKYLSQKRMWEDEPTASSFDTTPDKDYSKVLLPEPNTNAHLEYLKLQAALRSTTEGYLYLFADEKRGVRMSVIGLRPSVE